MEDTGLWPYNPHEGGISKSCEFNVDYLSKVTRAHGLDGRWAYRFPWQEQWFGIPDKLRKDVIRTADLFLNVSGTVRDPAQYRGRGRMVYIDSDPVFTQVKLARGQCDFRAVVDAHDVHLSFGEAQSSLVPDTGYHWLPTRQPVVLEEWRSGENCRETFTTVMNWTSYKPVEFRGVHYGQKDLEFRRFMDLPSRASPTKLEIAIAQGKTAQAPTDLLRHKGWRVVDPAVVCPEWTTYRRYLQSSKGEWSVAKHGYVAGQPGWFSCRSACYLAAGRPVVVQDTGIAGVIPLGEGVLTFGTIEEAVASLREIEGSYERHRKAALELAAAYFDSSVVISRLISDSLA
jgi:hypothetical protein